MQYRIEYNTDNSINIIMDFTLPDSEMGMEFNFNKLTEKFKREKKVLLVKAIKIIITSTLLMSIPFSIFAANNKDAVYAMSYVYFGNTQQQVLSVSNSASVVQTVSPSYFDINPDGSLKLNNISSSFISEMKKQDLKIVPFLSNHWDRETGKKALENAESLSDEIVAAINKYDLDGVNVDIENVTHTERESYTELVRLLREKLPDDKEVSVAVAANPDGWTQGWHGSYDYAELGKHADYLFIMTYDEHYYGGEPGAVAGISFIENSIKYALKYVPKEKIVIGIPFFGRMWSDDGTMNGDGLTLKAVSELAELHENEVYFDKESKSPYMILNVASEYKLNGKTLKPGKHVIWYENSDSIKEKLLLVSKYGLKGAGNWSAGQETDDVWDYYELWLNGKYFSDISDYFAKDDIIKLSKDGIIKGTSNSEFSPERDLTRAEAAVIVSRLLGLNNKNAEANFTDISGHWAENEISAIAEQGIIVGYPDKSFQPEKKITRAELSVIISRIIEHTYTDGTKKFSDVKSDHWAWNEISSLSKLGIINGYTDGTFRPENMITRGETAAMMNRLSEGYLS